MNMINDYYQDVIFPYPTALYSYIANEVFTMCISMNFTASKHNA